MTISNVIGTSPGPGSAVSTQTQAQLVAAPPGSAFSTTSVAAILATGPLNDVGANLILGYVSGVTNRLILTPASGGTTINGFDASGAADGTIMLIQNASATDSLTFAHLAAGSLAANRFSNMNAASVQIPPLGAAECTYIVNKWQFS
jgi:hypothetical protein